MHDQVIPTIFPFFWTELYNSTRLTFQLIVDCFRSIPRNYNSYYTVCKVQPNFITISWKQSAAEQMNFPSSIQAFQNELAPDASHQLLQRLAWTIHLHYFLYFNIYYQYPVVYNVHEYTLWRSTCYKWTGAKINSLAILCTILFELGSRKNFWQVFCSQCTIYTCIRFLGKYIFHDSHSHHRFIKIFKLLCSFHFQFSVLMSVINDLHCNLCIIVNCAQSNKYM